MPTCRMLDVPVIDLTSWVDGTDRARVAAAVDEALSSVGFFLLTGHGVPQQLVDDTRAAALAFFSLPIERKQEYRVDRLGNSGWAPMGLEANGYSFGEETPPDMKESYRFGAHVLPGRVALRGANVWPAEPVEFHSLVISYLREIDRVHMELLRVCAMAAGLDDLDHFARHAARNDNTLNINWYPPIGYIGVPKPNQFRVGPHTDFGTITVLDRQPGMGALQVRLPDGAWVDAPYLPGAFTINAGDMLALWSGERWRSAIHRVLPPPSAVPDESLLSLVYFCEPDPQTMIHPLAGDQPAVNAGDYLRAKIEAISMTES